MENILIFVFSLAIIISIISLVANASMVSFYQTIQAEKRMLEFFRGDVLTFFRSDGALTPTDKVLYITDVNLENGELNITNAGLSDVYSVRLMCWKRDNPINTITTLSGEINGVIQPVSVEVLSSLPQISTIEYNLYLFGFSRDDINNGNVGCVLAGVRFIRGFVPHG